VTLTQKLIAYTLCYANLLGVTPRFHIDLVFETETNEEYTSYAIADPAYLDAEIGYVLTDLAAAPDSVLKEYAVHEVLHVLLWEFAAYAERASDSLTVLAKEEQLITSVSRRPMWQRFCTMEKP